MSPTLREIVTLPDWQRWVRVVAGASGTDRQVLAVREVTPASADIHAGDLLVRTDPVVSHDWRIDVLLRHAHDAGAAGLLVSAGADLTGSIRLADRLGIPLLRTGGRPLDLLVSARLLVARPDIEQATLVLAAHDRFLGEPGAPHEVAEQLRSLLGANVLLVDDSGERLAGETRYPGHIKLTRPVPQQIPAGDGSILLAHPACLPPSARPSQWLVVELDEMAAPRAAAVTPVIAAAARMIERWLLAHRLDLERDARSRAALLDDLLQHRAEPTADLRRRAADAGFQLGGWHVGIRIETSADVDHVARRPEVTHALLNEGISAVVVEHGQGWTSWMTFPHEPTAARVAATSASLRAAHRRLQRTITAHAGVGRPHPNLDGVAETIIEAGAAARLAASRPETGHFLHVDKLGVAQLLLEWTRTDTFEPAARALLAPLTGAHGDLVRTLTTYLDSGSSILETAGILGVHRNTVAGRIARIESLLGLDLHDPDERLALQLACRTVSPRA
ncbi:helix-turn-helix domain-containing protein [Amycolatopsis jejuensis]|uniref:helix-turn-helix domain-containing protein n=1 Tax=Amycolatopsis jejuensis TaxID=330084 RepID=UPI000526FAE8|nr:PucR family transcriptional regulator [Amycolatopsis jejuensis]